jgi:hypothetical protein
VNAETFYRGAWLYCCASDAQVADVRNGDGSYPKFMKMAEEVDRAFGSTGRLKLEGELWGLLSEFTHTCGEQLSRRFDAEGRHILNYPLAEVLQILSSATMLLSTHRHVRMMGLSPSRTGLLAQTFWRSPGSRAQCLLTCMDSSTMPSPAATRE